MRDWPAGHESLVTLTLTAVADGTRLQLVQTGVPGDEAPRTEYGWRVQFFQRMKMVFGYGA
jgi:activator of HSP90 ATPase